MQVANRWSILIFRVILVLMLAALALYAFLGLFTRYMADDYCTAASLKDVGFWSAQSYWWNNWSGRYSFTFLVIFVELFGLGIVPILPAVILLLWGASIVWALYPALKGFHFPDVLSISVFAASVTLWITYQMMDDYPQVIFWQTGILTYPVSPILFLFGVGFALHRSLNSSSVRWWELLIWFLFAFFAGGFSETGVAVQTALLGLSLIFAFWSRSQKRGVFIPILIAALAGSFISFLVIALAPGNLARSGGFHDIPPLLPGLLGSLTETLEFLPGLFKANSFPVIFGFITGGFIAYIHLPDLPHLDNRSIIKYMIFALAVTGIGIWTGIAPAYILRGGVPPERVLLFSYFITACLLVCWGALIAMLLWFNLPSITHRFQRWASVMILLIMILWGVVPVMVSQVRLVPVLQEYSTIWDDRHQDILSESHNGGSIITVDDITRNASLRKLNKKLWLTGELETSSDNWINQCAARYYGVDGIVTK